MSVEALLLALAFVVLPLVEMFVARRRAQREAEQQRREEAAQRQERAARLRQQPAAQREPAPEDSAWVQDISRDRLFLSEPEIVAPSEPARRTMSDKVAARRRAAQQEAAAQPLSGRASYTDPHPVAGVIRGLRSPGGLQRAMVIMAALGPCRAIEPYSWRDIDEPR